MAKEQNTIEPKNSTEWRNWLEEHHDSGQLVWVICSKKNADEPTMTHDEGVDVALCFGWIDGTAKSLDADRYIQSFTRRKPKSVWSKISKAKVASLIKAGLMTKAGFDVIEVAKNNGYWSILDDVEELIIPKDLEERFAENPSAKAYFDILSRSDKKRVLQWLVLAQRPETRLNRIEEIITAAGEGRKPKPIVS
jgi:uncharacterized protein YdeI (YjbR/CyaY-like superfamily)